MLFESHYIVGRLTASGGNLGLVVNEQLPPWWRVFLTVAAFGVLQEPVFYYSHKLVRPMCRLAWLYNLTHPQLHWGPLYRHIHKQHHRFHAPIALAAVYSHPVEFGLQNILPLFMPYLLLRTHLFTFYVGIVINVVGTQLHHCGYRFPWWMFPFGVTKDSIQPDFHDFHHEKTHCNYGITGWCDSLHGTDRVWKAAVAEQQRKYQS